MEVFNVKIIEYANGQVEVRKYSEPIGIHSLKCINETSEDVSEKIEFGKMIAFMETHTYIEENPFDESGWCLPFDDDATMSREERDAKNLRDSLNRSKNAVYQLARQSRWKYFITLTFDPLKVDRSDYSACMKIANEWFHNQRKRYAPNLKYLFVGELHADHTNWHIHGLIDDVGAMKFVDSGKRDKAGRYIYNVGSWSSGWSTAVAIEQTDESIFKISSYITQYITKDLCVRTKGKRRYYRSQNIDDPIVHTAWLKPCELDNYIDIVMDSLGAEIVYEKDLSGYIDVNYRYYKKSMEERCNE